MRNRLETMQVINIQRNIGIFFAIIFFALLVGLSNKINTVSKSIVKRV